MRHCGQMAESGDGSDRKLLTSGTDWPTEMSTTYTHSMCLFLPTHSACACSFLHTQHALVPSYTHSMCLFLPTHTACACSFLHTQHVLVPSYTHSMRLFFPKRCSLLELTRRHLGFSDVHAHTLKICANDASMPQRGRVEFDVWQHWSQPSYRR
jgi:hypothetical protein